MPTYNDLSVENLIWAAIEPSQNHQDFVSFVKHFPNANYERRHYAINQACALHRFDTTPISLYSYACDELTEAFEEPNNSEATGLMAFHLGKMYHNGIGIEQDHANAVSYYRLAIDHGEVRSLVNLANLYREGNGVEKDLDYARALLHRAVDQGEPLSLVLLSDMIDDDNDPQKFALCSQSVDMGCAHAMGRLSYFFRTGKAGVEKDLSQAQSWLIRAAKAGHPESSFLLGAFYEDGVFGDKDPAASLEWYRLGESLLEPGCLCALGIYYSHGLVVEEDVTKARAYFKRAALLGSSNAHRRLGESLLFQSDDPALNPKGIEWLKAAAALGDLYACQELFDMYLKGRKAPIDVEQAHHYILQAATGGLPESQWRLAYAYWVGPQGFPIDHSETFEWLTLCAMQGDVVGIFWLAQAYGQGVGCEKNLQEAARLLERAVEMGYPPAMHTLGCAYFYGQGIDADPARGMVLLKQAAELGEARAMTTIGRILIYGEHVLENPEEAHHWFLKAAGLDDAHAMYCLGIMYEHGDGVEEDSAQARRWMAKAAMHRHSDAIEWLKENTPQTPAWLTRIISGEPTLADQNKTENQ